MSTKQGQIVGLVTFREGDGVEIVIPEGPVEVTVTSLDATLTWHDGNTNGSTSMPLGEYHRYIQTGAIKLKS